MGTAEGRAKHKALWDTLVSEEQALARGGAEADLVLARQAVGTAVLGTVWMLWAGGAIIGKQSAEERRDGVLDYSVRLPDGTWMQYTGLSPVAEMLGLVADTAAEFRKRDPDDDQAAAIMGALAAAIRNNIVNKSFMKGIADFMEMATGGQYGAPTDSGKAGEQIWKQVGDAVIPRAIPGGALLRRVAQEQDPVIRDTKGWMEQVWAGVPLMSDTLAARRDFLGRPMVRPEGQRGTMQAFNTSRPTVDKLERALAQLARENAGFKIGMTPRGDMTPQEYSRLLEVQGQLHRSRSSGKNMEETLRDLVGSREYLEATPEGREYQVQRVITRFRTEANRATKNPASPYYMAEWAKRSGLKKWENRAKERGWSSGQALGQARSFGLDTSDPEIQALHSTLFPAD